MSKLSIEKFLNLLEEVHNHGMSYNKIGEQIGLSSAIIHNARAGKPASITTGHIVGLQLILDTYKSADAKSLRAVNAFDRMNEQEAEIKELKAELAELTETIERLEEAIKAKGDYPPKPTQEEIKKKENSTAD